MNNDSQMTHDLSASLPHLTGAVHRGTAKGLRACLAAIILIASWPAAADTDGCTTAGQNLATSLQTCLDSSAMPNTCIQQALAKYENLVRKIDGGCDDEGGKLRDCVKECKQDDLSCVRDCLAKHKP